MKIDTSNFDLRNIDVNQSGELSVRGGEYIMQTLVNPESVTAAAGRQSFVGERALSVKSQFVDDIQFYVIGGNRDTPGVLANGDLWLQILEENLTYGNRKQCVNLGRYRPIRAMSSAVINGQLIISGPDIPTLWGYTGSGLTFARKQDSINVTVETLSVPNGICVSWAGRCVIAKGETLFISDPLAPRTYTAGGIVPLAGIIYGLHVGINGDLVAVTADGVFSLSSQAAAQGQRVIGSVQKLSNYRASKYNCSALTPSGIYGLTKRGIIRIDVESGQEISLSDGSYVRSLTEMINFPDYRVGEIFETQKGACISIGDMDDDGDGDYTGGACMVNFESGLKSWWTIKGRSSIKSIFKTREGDDSFFVLGFQDILVSKTHIQDFNRIGNSNIAAPTTGFVSGIVASGLETSPVVRQVYLSANNGGLKVNCAVRGQKFKRNGSLQEVTTKSNGVVIGTDDWATAMTDSRRYKTAELIRARFDFAKKTNDISIEAGIQGATSRIRLLNIDIAGYGVNTA